MRRLLLGCLMVLPNMCEASSFDLRYFRVGFYDDTITGPLYHVNYVDKDGWWWLGLDLTVEITLIAGGNYDLTFDLGAGGAAQSWIAAQQGDIVSHETMDGLSDDQYLVHYDGYGGGHIGQTHMVVEPYEEIYLAFAGTDGVYTPPDVYGWIALSIDMGGTPSVHGAYDDEHRPMMVGDVWWRGGIPEPSGGMLLLLGVAVLALRRRKSRQNV